MNKSKVVWLCHFTNAEMQSLLPLWKLADEFASWIPNMLKGFETYENIELHIISPHEYLKKYTKLTVRNINYHFIPFGIPFWHRHWPVKFRFDIFTNFCVFRNKVKKIVNKIQPDLINLIGAENAYYSSSIIDFKNTHPVLVTIQGFVAQLKGAKVQTRELDVRMDVEEKILKTFKYFCGEQDSSNFILPYNPNHFFFKLYFPVNEELVNITAEAEKIYDCIYFGQLSRIKGTEDFIKAIAEIKTFKPDIKAVIVGGGNPDQFKALSKDIYCEKNIEFVGFVETQKELYKYIKSSRVFLVPPHKERLSSTIREAMFLKTPIVAYATGGIPYINEFDEYIYLVKTGDYKEMARKTIILLENDILRNNLAEKAYHFAVQEFSLKVNIERTISAYNTILSRNLNLKNGL